MKLWLILRAIALFGFAFSIAQAATPDIAGSITNVSADASIPTSSTLTATGAVDDLTVTLIADEDEDDENVPDTVDLCPNTVIPENAPTSGRLGNNRWALTTQSFDFIQASPQNGQVFGFSSEDTHGCSCEQIVDAADLGRGHLRKGCSTGEMLNWINGL